MKKLKFYGVRVGRIPGIYYSWEECKKQVIGYPGAEFESFDSKIDAIAYMRQVRSYYVVRKGHKPGVYKSYEDCMKQVIGYHNPVFRKFYSEEEAYSFLYS